MNLLFYVSAVIAIGATLLVITRSNAIHALLYLVVSLLAVALIFYALGAAFAAALEVIVYAGAIMVLFVFVVMMLNFDEHAARRERQWLAPRSWIGPTLLCLVLAGELGYALLAPPRDNATLQLVEPEQVGLVLYGPYLLAVELASMLLLAGLVAAYHLGRGAEQE